MSETIDREKLIREKIGKTEERAVRDLAIIREMVRDHLITVKGYEEADIEKDREFRVLLDDMTETVSADYIISLEGKRFIVIKCSPGALESRERHLVSFARVVDAYQIPFAMVTDGNDARLLDTLTGKIAGQGLNSLPHRSEAVDLIKSLQFIPYPRERLDREKRILLAFEVIKCTQESCE